MFHQALCHNLQVQRRHLRISSILEHDHQTFVFSPDGDAGFRRINIILGLRVDGVVEVISGLSAGEQVVATGGFYLKSEMLLQGEE